MAKKKDAPLKVQAEMAKKTTSKNDEAPAVVKDDGPASVPVYVDKGETAQIIQRGARGAGVKPKPTFTTSYLKAVWRRSGVDMSFRQWLNISSNVGGGRAPAPGSKAAQLCNG